MRSIFTLLFRGDDELLRNYPVLWSCNLHRLPKRVFWYLLAMAGVALLMWLRLDRSDPLIVIGVALLPAAVGVGAVIAQYSGVPNDEYIPTPSSVHIVAFCTRFVSLTVVILAPLLLGELALARMRQTNPAEIVADINDINTGVAACCRQDPLGPLCARPPYIPRDAADAQRLATAQLPLLSPADAAARAAACPTGDCVAQLIDRLDDLLVKHRDFSNTNSYKSTSDVETSRRNACAALGVHFEQAELNMFAVLGLHGTVRGSLRTINKVFYADTVLWSAWIALLITISLSEALVGAFAIVLAPYVVATLLVMVWGAVSLIRGGPIDEIPWPRTAVEIALKGYLIACGVAYIIAAVRVIQRPFEKDRMLSLIYVGTVPLIVLALGPASDIRNETILGLDGNAYRAAAFFLWLFYALASPYLRREGELMRALPAKSSSRQNR